MPSCAAKGCPNTSGNSSVRYFPRDPQRRKLWAERVGRPNWMPNDSSCLCDDHFDQDQWEKKREDGKKCLKCNAVPTLFQPPNGRKRKRADANGPATNGLRRISPANQAGPQRVLLSPTPICDIALVENSTKGWFGWSEIEDVLVPYIFRGEEKFTSTRILESSVFKKYDSIFHPDIYSCVKLTCWNMHHVEVRLFNEINNFHCEGLFGKKAFSLSDALISLDDAVHFNKFLAMCKMKLYMTGEDPKCGFIKLNKEAVVPYVLVDSETYLPTFYFEGEVAEIREHSKVISGWDLVYLKFCCKVQRIREELYDQPSCEVVGLSEIKKQFPSNSTFEIFWPNEVAKDFVLSKNNPPS